MNINPNELARFRADFKKAVEDLQEKYDVTISLGPISYNEDEFSAKMTVDNGRDPEAIERKDFDKNVWKYEHLGFTKGMYRRIFLAANGGKYAIVGFNTRAKKYPLVVADIHDGKLLRASAGFVKAVLDEYYVQNLIGNVEDLDE